MKGIRQLGLAAVVCACFVVGCQQEGGGGSSAGQARTGTDTTGSHKTIPSAARPVEQGGGQSKIIHRMLREGTIYVQDATNNTVVYSGPVRANSNVVVDPEANAIAVNDIQVRSEARLDPAHHYKLYFLQK